MTKRAPNAAGVPRMTLQQYAAHRGCSLAAVHKAITRGALRDSARRDGRAWSIDPAGADREWAAKTQPAKQRGKAAARAAADRATAAELAPPWAGRAATPAPAASRRRPPAAPPATATPAARAMGASPDPVQAEEPGAQGPAEAPMDGDLATAPLEELLQLLEDHRGDVAWAQAIDTEIKARARLVELQRRQGDLVEVFLARRALFKVARDVREKLLMIPDRVASELAASSDPNQIAALLERELVSALEELSTPAEDPFHAPSHRR